ncbi:MAG: thioredoxin family protein [Candidatus Marinimicrobia bacterium]|nr:thioredoxin family protein [Candidatus Neomarinimicrobiota bacterium]
MKVNQNDIFKFHLDMNDNKNKMLIFSSSYNPISMVIKDYTDELYGIYNEFIEFRHYELERDEEFFKNAKITIVPTILFIKKKELIDYTTGIVTKKELEEKIKTFLNIISINQ